ncbi:hypothetical protein CPB84DRAFT_1858390 [Gymnopilus junonius]|uniref:Uncharacterized protein n=1 Tax=Gymnopilus junonius TaxID=109634 RepID=A0A9P5N867_GYMJU|nr:hypothetical protein CPB84DRAFT_1858390 [Gymnopilus junonius]
MKLTASVAQVQKDVDQHTNKYFDAHKNTFLEIIEGLVKDKWEELTADFMKIMEVKAIQHDKKEEDFKKHLRMVQEEIKVDIELLQGEWDETRDELKNLVDWQLSKVHHKQMQLEQCLNGHIRVTSSEVGNVEDRIMEVTSQLDLLRMGLGPFAYEDDQ